MKSVLFANPSSMNYNLKISLLFSAIVMSLNLCFANTLASDSKSDSGAFSLTIDISGLENHSGKFMVMVGGRMYLPEPENSTLKVNSLLEEPRKASIYFYPNESINKNPNKSLNEIAVKLIDTYSFLAEKGQCSIQVGRHVAASNITNPTLAQSEFASLLQLKNDFYKILEPKFQELTEEYKNIADGTYKDSLMRSNIQSIMRIQNPIYYNDKILNFIKDHPNSPVSALELDEYCYSGIMDLQTLNILYNNFSEEVKNLPTGQRINKFIGARDFERNIINKEALDFSQDDIHGNKLALSDYKGKYVLIEFWASWCGACIHSFPALRNIYHKYKGDNFEILGISLDTNRENWIKAIQAYDLDWPNISDLKGWNNVVAKQYKISGVPSNFLIDKTGKIIGYDLDDNELEEALSKMN